MRHAVLVIGTIAATLMLPAHARNVVYQIPLDDIFAMPESQGKLDGSIYFYLAGQQTPKVVSTMGIDVKAQKAGGAKKDEEQGCRPAALAALVAFQDTARSKGADAVVNIVSYYKNVEVRNDQTIECHAGSFSIGVTLRGTYARTER